MTFKIGDNIIMTADNGKGRVFEGLQGEYKGKVIVAPDDYINMYPICIQLENGDIWSFKDDGSRPTSPGMSIRPAESRVVTASFSRCEQCGAKDFIGKHVCTQWIVGQIPNTVIGKLFHVLCEDGEIRQVYRPNEYSQNYVMADGKWKEYTHYCPTSIPLPPPPPAKEVEAYGMLHYINTWSGVDLPDSIERARAFYSQPATAENLEKYLKCEHKSMRFDFTIDQFINWHNGQHDDKLLFTPAALDMLRVK